MITLEIEEAPTETDLQEGTRDYIDVSGLSFRHLQFRLTDDKGTVIPLEAPLSFSLVFSAQDK